ncbi:MAG: GDSL-type esterase/lipase family protein [Candidatus Gracilibacteria bacterium]|jgi:lysophospholipase L1-like esterase
MSLNSPEILNESINDLRNDSKVKKAAQETAVIGDSLGSGIEMRFNNISQQSKSYTKVGASLDFIKNKLKEVNPEKTPNLIIQGGTNDLNNGKSPQEVADKLVEIYENAKIMGFPKKIIVTIPPSTGRLANDIEATNEILRQYAKSGKISAMDLFDLNREYRMQDPNLENIGKDKIHLNDQGYDLMGKLLLRKIIKDELGIFDEEISNEIFASLTEPKKTGTMHETVKNKVKELKETEKYRKTLKKSSISNIRYSRLFHEDKENDSQDTRITNTEAEMYKRINAYTSDYDGEWGTLDYQTVGGLEHDHKVGIGDILVDPKVTRIIIFKGGRYIEAERKINEKGRIGFHDVKTGKYVCTYTGDKFRILDNNEDLGDTKTPEYKTKYINKLNEENIAREKNREIYYDNIYENQVAVSDALFNIFNVDILNATNGEIIKTLTSAPAEKFIEFRNKIGWKDLKKFFKETGIINYFQKDELSKEIKTQVNKLPNENSLITSAGSKKVLIEILMKLAAYESGGYKPFNWSSTGCMGFFQFNMGNTDNYKINPTNAADAVKGELMLMEDNNKILEGATMDELIVAHNRGAGNAKKYKEDPSSIEGDIYGNGPAEKYIASIKGTDPNNFTDLSPVDLNAPLSGYDLESAPYMTSETSTLCSRTAAINLRERFNIMDAKIGNAIDVQRSYNYDNNYQKISGESNTAIEAQLTTSNATVVDLFVESKSQYGHRAVAYFNGKEWQILDPYTKLAGNQQTKTGISFSEYPKKIIFAVPLKWKTNKAPNVE